jgi:hypothetical protein
VGCAEDFDPASFDFQYQGDCVFFSIPFAVSEDGRWQTMIDVGYRERLAEKPAEGILPCNFYELRLLPILPFERRSGDAEK